MRNFFLSIFILFAIVTVTAQQNEVDYNKYNFKNIADCKAAEQDVLKVSGILLSSDITKAELDRLKASKFLMDWMEATPDYKFTIDSNINLLGSNPKMTGLYLAAKVKYVLENPASANEENAVKVGTWTSIADYVAKPEHNVKLTRKLKMLIEANNNGTLSTFLK